MQGVAHRRPAGRALSPVIGVVLLVAIVLLLSVAASGILFGLTDEREPAPEVTFSLESDQQPGERWIRHDQGQIIDGDKVELRGVADPETMAGTRLAAGERHPVVPTAETIEMVWEGDHGTTYLLWEFSVEPSVVVPEPDEGCQWVQTESNGGTDDVKVDGVVVNCEIETDKVIEIQDGAVIGHVTSRTKLLDVDDGDVYGDVIVENDVNLQDGTIVGSVTARTENVKIDTGTVEGSIEAQKVIEVIDGSSVDGPVRSTNRDVKVLSSSVDGDVVGADGVKLQDATVEGDVYAPPAGFDCTNAEINGEDCSAYTPKDPAGY